KEAALKQSRKLVPENDEFALEIIEGAAENSDHASRIVASTIEAINTLPFFGGNKVVWLKDANFFSDNVVGKAQATLNAIEGLLELLKAGLPGDVKVIISATDVDKRRTFYKQMGKLAEVDVFDKVDISKTGWETEVIATVSKRADALGLSFAPGAMDRFVLSVGADTRQIESELEKLSLYCGSETVTEDIVSQMCAATHSGVIFEIGDALAKRQLPKTLSLIERQLSRGESPIGIMRAAIIPKIRGLLHAKDLVTRHRLSVGRNYRGFESAVNALPASETGHLPRKKDGNISAYPIFLSAQVADRFNVSELKEALVSCLEAETRLVTTSLEPKIVLSQLVAKILS
ncbi:MAG: DNA polymerase III subunit delta, partial [Verrucomicrobiota bacterium]